MDRERFHCCTEAQNHQLGDKKFRAMFSKKFYHKNPVAGKYSCSLVSMLICLLGRVLLWIHCGEFWRGKMGCCCSGKMGFKSLAGDSITENGKKCKKRESRVKQFRCPFRTLIILNSRSGFYSRMLSNLMSKSWQTLHKNYHVFFVTIYWQLKADEVSLVTA